MPRSVPFEHVLNHHLQNPEQAMSYLRSALEENDAELLSAALQDVVKAQTQLTPTISKLVESPERHGIDSDIITSIIADLHDTLDAA